MSTLKVAAINNPSAGSGGLAISTVGLVTGAGLDLIVAQSFSAASSVSVNNCFTSTYASYRIVFTDCRQSTAAWAGLRFRASGTDTATGYIVEMIDKAGGGSVGALAGSSTEFRWTWADYGGGGVMDIIGPQLAQPTAITALMNGQASGTVWASTGAGALQNTTQYDGFTLIPGGAYTLTGSLRVYGYRN